MKRPWLADSKPVRFNQACSALLIPVPISANDRIIAAAIECFSVSGSKVTVAEIAAQAGVTSRTLYRVFPSRRDLVKAVAINRLDVIIEKVRPYLEAQRHLADALVTGLVGFTREARADPVFIAALDEASDWQMERFLVGPDGKFFARADSLWRVSINRANKSQQWKPGLDASQVNSWLRAVAVILLLRDDLDTAGQKQLIRNFVIPALVA